ncbi:MAG: ATP-binding cassette domain-containing protein [Candidatus Hydrogenedentales bacterium]
MPALAFDNVHKRFGTVDAVRGLSFTLAARQSLALFGPSGCGKSTALRLAAGLMLPDSGTIRIGDHIASGNGVFMPPQRRNVGFVFQDLSLWPHLNARRQLLFVLRETTRTRAERNARCDELLDLVGLADRPRALPRELSGGEQQRLAFARALASDPKLLLLDEPFAHLDRARRDALIAHLRSLQGAQQAPIVFATHDREDVAALADVVILMNEEGYENTLPMNV